MTKPISKWLRRHFLVIPHRENEIALQGPNGEKVSLIIHHAFEKVREGMVYAAPYNPKYDVMRYVRMMKSDVEAIKLTHKTVESPIKEGDVIGFAMNQVKDDQFENKVTFLDCDEELYEVDFSTVFYWKPKGTKEIKVTPGWAIISMEKQQMEKYGNLLLFKKNDYVPTKGVIEYISEGEGGSSEFGLKPGDKIMFTKDMNVAVEIDGRTLFMIAHSQILGTYE